MRLINSCRAEKSEFVGGILGDINSAINLWISQSWQAKVYRMERALKYKHFLCSFEWKFKGRAFQSAICHPYHRKCLSLCVCVCVCVCLCMCVCGGRGDIEKGGSFTNFGKFFWIRDSFTVWRARSIFKQLFNEVSFSLIFIIGFIGCGTNSAHEFAFVRYNLIQLKSTNR